MALDELKAELAGLLPDLEAADEALETARALKAAADEAAEEQRGYVLAAIEARDPIRLKVMSLQREIGILEGVPEQKAAG